MSPADTRSGFGSGVVTGLAIGLVVAALVTVVGGLLVDDSGDDPVVDAREVIEDNYFRVPDQGRLDDASIDAMVESLRSRYDDRFSHYFNPEQYEAFIAADLGELLGRRADRDRGARGACGSPACSPTRRRKRASWSRAT